MLPSRRPLRRVAVLPALVVAAVPAVVSAEQASNPATPASGHLDAGANHTCAVQLPQSTLRCWGFNGDGQLGYGNRETIGDFESPGSVGPVNLGTGRTAAAVSAGEFHTCALLDDAAVRCWGVGGGGQLGYGNTNDIGDNEPPASAGPVNLGHGRTARAVSAGSAHTCAILDDRSVRCWGVGASGRLGYGNIDDIGDSEPPGSVGPVDLGAGLTAKAISAGATHTCAVLSDDNVRCWGAAGAGQLGYGNTDSVGNNEPPGSAGPVNLGTGRTAKAISAGSGYTCAVLDNGDVRCWGSALGGRLGYGTPENVGDNEPPGSVDPVALGEGRTARAIATGTDHSCALLDDGTVRCWGAGGYGQLGYGSFETVGDDEEPASAGPVNLGTGRTAVAITAGARHTCARLDDGTLRCWGYGGTGQLGYCNQSNIGDNEAPGPAGPVLVDPPAGGGSGCPGTSGGGPPSLAGPAPSATPAASSDGHVAQAARLRGLRSCLARTSRHTRRESRRARRLSGLPRARARRHILRHRGQLRRRCLERWGRTPGPVGGLRARAASRTEVSVTFAAAGTDGSRPPAAQSYVVKQSRRPIRSARAFRGAQTLCEGSCRFPTVDRIGRELTLAVRDLRPRTTYYYSVAARDNVSGRLGRRSQAVKVTTAG